MDASELIRRKLQATISAAAVESSKKGNAAFIPVTTNNITLLSTMTLVSEDNKINFDAGMRYLYYDAAGIPYLSSMNFCAQRLPKQ
jgi:hypothetical protein